MASVAPRTAAVAAALALLQAVTACDAGRETDSPRSSPLSGVAQVGQVVRDPAREISYFSDTARGRIVGVSTRDGSVERFLEIEPDPTLMVADDCGSRLFVSVPGLKRIYEIDLDRFQIVNTFDQPETPSCLHWLKSGHLLVVTGSGIWRIDAAMKTRDLFTAAITSPALLASSPAQDVLYALMSRDGGNLLGSFPLATARSSPPSSTAATGPTSVNEDLLGNPLTLEVSYDGRRLLVGADGMEGVYVLDAQTLETLDTIDLGGDLNAADLNPTRTRMYVLRGDSMVESYNTLYFTSGAEDFVAEGVHRSGLAVCGDALTMLLHKRTDQLVTYPLFAARLLAAPTARLGSRYVISAEGEPGEPFFLAWAIQPGFLFLDSPADPNPRFADLDPAFFAPFLRGAFDAEGKWSQEFRIPNDAALDRVELVIQLIARESLGGPLAEVSNPVTIRLASPCK